MLVYQSNSAPSTSQHYSSPLKVYFLFNMMNSSLVFQATVKADKTTALSFIWSNPCFHGNSFTVVARKKGFFYLFSEWALLYDTHSQKGFWICSFLLCRKQSFGTETNQLPSLFCSVLNFPRLVQLGDYSDPIFSSLLFLTGTSVTSASLFLQVEMLERKYGGRFITRHAARTIQTAFRQYQMNKNFERLRSSMSENRMSRRIVLSNMRMQFSFEGPEKVHSSYFEGKQVSLTDDGTKIGALVQSEHGGEMGVQAKAPTTQSDFTDAITELEDAFSRQVKSLAESIDDALNCRSLHGDDSQSEPGRGHQDLDREVSCQVKPPHSTSEHRKLDEMTASYSDVTLYIDEEELSPPLPLSQSVERPSSTESDLRHRSLNSSQEYWSMAHKDEKGDTDTSCRSTPSLECQEQRLRVDHLPLLTIEPPSDSSVELSDRSDRSSLKRQNAYERSLSNQQSSSKQMSHGLPPRGPSREEDTSRHRPRQLEAHLAINGTANRQSKSESDFSDGDNDSINSTSNSNDTINCSSESSSRDSLREQTLSKQTYHKETRNSWDSPAFSNDIIRKRHYRIGLNLFNKYV